MHFLRSIPLALALALSCLPGQAAIIHLSSPSAVTAGDPLTVEVSVDLAPGESLYAYQISFVFPSFLEADSVTALGYLANYGLGIVPFIDNVNGTIVIFDSLSGGDLLTNSDSLARITFHTLAAGLGEVTVDAPFTILLDGNFADVELSGTSPGSVQAVAPGSSVPEPDTLLLCLGGLALLLRRRPQFLLQPAPGK